MDFVIVLMSRDLPAAEVQLKISGWKYDEGKPLGSDGGLTLGLILGILVEGAYVGIDLDFDDDWFDGEVLSAIGGLVMGCNVVICGDVR